MATRAITQGAANRAVLEILAETQQANAAIQGLTARLDGLGDKTTSVAGKTTQAAKATGLYRGAALGLAGALQDAQYGMRAMANNLEMTITQLGLANEKNSSWNTTLKEFKSVLFGPLGLMIGLSLIPTALALVSRAFANTKKSTEEAWSALKLYNAALAEAIGKTPKEALFRQRDELRGQEAGLVEQLRVMGPLTSGYAASQGTRVGGAPRSALETRLANIRAELEMIDKRLVEIAAHDKYGLVTLPGFAPYPGMGPLENFGDVQREFLLGRFKESDAARQTELGARQFGKTTGLESMTVPNPEQRAKEVADSIRKFRDKVRYELATDRGPGGDIFDTAGTPLDEAILGDFKDTQARLEDLGAGIKNGLINASFDVLSGRASFMEALGGFAMDLGASLIEFGVAGKAVKLFVKHPNLAIVAGAALVALGGKLARSAQSKADNFAGQTPGLTPEAAYGGGGGGTFYGGIGPTSANYGGIYQAAPTWAWAGAIQLQFDGRDLEARLASVRGDMSVVRGS